MPKKLSTNTKSVEARDRKAAEKKAASERTARAAEDLLWKDDDKNLAKKQAKKEEEERKKVEAARKKAEKKVLLEQEMASIKTGAKQSISKITQAEIQAEVDKRNKVIAACNAPPKPEPRLVREDPLEENLNRAMAMTTIATTVDEAIAALNVADIDPDKHPEKRMKAAYKAFETNNLPRVKAEYPSMKLSQWKQILFKEWSKSPENPLNKQ